MSNALAIGAVTAVLRQVLSNGLTGLNVPAGGVPVSALPLDRAVSSSNGEDPNQLNLFLHRVTPNLGWSNATLPTFDQNGQRVSNTPLALDLHYLLTAYGSKDFHAEILLGRAMQLMHETPVLRRNDIRLALAKPLLQDEEPAFRALAAAELADQVEQVKISLESLDTEEISRLWASFQSAYRPTVVYQATVVLIEGRKDARSAQPVLKRGKEDRGVDVRASMISPFPILEEVVPPNQEGIPPEHQQPIARPGDVLTLRGQNLEADTVAVRFDHRLLPEPLRVEIPDSDRTSTELRVSVPNAPARWPAGIYSLTAALRPEEEDEQAAVALERTTTALPMFLAPKVAADSLPASTKRKSNGTATLNLRCSPRARPEQRVSVLVADREVIANEYTQPTATLTFVIEKAPLGEHRLRLRVDGVDSLLIDRTTWPPRFDETQKVRIT